MEKGTFWSVGSGHSFRPRSPDLHGTEELDFPDAIENFDHLHRSHDTAGLDCLYYRHHLDGDGPSTELPGATQRGDQSEPS